MTRLLGVMVLALVTLPAFAGVPELRRETATLHFQVQNSDMSYAVKRAVADFGNEVEGLAWCGHPNTCQYQVDRVKRAFSTVHYYLRDAYSYRLIYQTFRRVENEVYHLGYPNPPQGEWYADGALDGRQFRFRAHDLNTIYRMCLDFARYYSLYAIKRVDVNGNTTTYFNPVAPDQACSFVSQFARRF